MWYFAAAEEGGKDFDSSTLLLISTFLQNVWYVKLSRVLFPLYIAMMASSPALMISCFVTALGNLFNTSIAVAKLSQAICFNAIPFPNPKILDVVSHPKIALVLVYSTYQCLLLLECVWYYIFVACCCLFGVQISNKHCMEIEDYCDNKAESIDLYHRHSISTVLLDWSHSRAVFIINPHQHVHGVQRIYMS